MFRGFSRQAFVLACFLFVALAPSAAFAHSDASEIETEHIERFDIAIEIAKDGTIHVVETIRYDFGPAEKHGIYRDIPIKYAAPIGTQTSLAIKVTSVEDALGKKLTHEESRSGGNLRIKIGDADRLVSGTFTYVIRYRVEGALASHDGFDELYWNATGHDWTVPIEAASVTVQTLQSTTGWRFACYVGPRGSTERCDRVATSGEEAASRSQVRIDWDRILLSGSGITVALGFDKGYVTLPNWFERAFIFFINNPFILLPFVVFGYMFRCWWREGRDPKGRGTVIPEYDVPEGLSPLHIAALQDGQLTGKEIPAAIIDLAVKGHLTIERVVEKALIFDTTDYRIAETINHPDKGTIEESLIEAIFGTQTANTQNVRELRAFLQAKPLPDFLKRSIESILPKNAEPVAGPLRSLKVSELKNKFYTKIPDLQKRAVADLVTRRLLAASPQEIRGKYTLWGTLLLMAAFLFIPLFELQAASIVAIIVTIPIYFVFVYFMPRVTKEGAILKERLLGLKDYLQIAEKRRIEFHNAPEKTPELFERLLPAALLLGVSDIWAKEFADLTLREPGWYHGGNAASFSASSFASDLGGFNSAAGSSLASAPSSSGSGGGGSSGGGAGGGGGGSW